MIDPNKVDRYASEQLKLLRATAGISQTMLGEEAGVSFQQIQKYERGSNRMTAGRVFQFSQIFDVSVRVFFPENEGMSYEPVPPTIVRILKCLNKIPPEFHEDVLRILRACARLSGGENAAD